jgi:hypothetical protein
MNETLLNRPEALQILFHPREDFGHIRPDAHIVSVELNADVDIGGRLYPASDPHAPAILYYHGNGEIAADYDHIADMYTRMGVALLVMDYRGYGMSGGTPTASNLVHDAMPVFEKVSSLFEAHDLAPAQRYVMGRSLGSVPAIEIAANAGDRLEGLIIESGFSDTFGLLARLGGLRAGEGITEERDGFGNGAKMERVTIPTLVLHGENDILIPPSDGKELHQRCAAANKRLELIPFAGHNDIMVMGMSQYFGAIRDMVHGQVS